MKFKILKILSTKNNKKESNPIIMLFTESKLKGAFIIEPEKLADERGFFARSYCFREFEKHRLNPKIAQCNISYNAKKGTMRGMHYQIPPHEESEHRLKRLLGFDSTSV